jgi:hypothetical protein
VDTPEFFAHADESGEERLRRSHSKGHVMNYMKRSSRSLIAMGVFLICAQIVTANGVKYDYSRSVDFTQYQTFMWGSQPSCTHGGLSDQIVNVVNALLESKGLHLVSGNPDLQVFAEITTPMSTGRAFQEREPYLGPGSPGKFTDSYKLDADDYKPGTLVIDLVDVANDRIVWWGTAKKFLYEDAPEGPKNVAKVLEKMFSGNQWWTTMP